jgi:hypothetical protein
VHLTFRAGYVGIERCLFRIELSIKKQPSEALDLKFTELWPYTQICCIVIVSTHCSMIRADATVQADIAFLLVWCGHKL